MSKKTKKKTVLFSEEKHTCALTELISTRKNRSENIKNKIYLVYEIKILQAVSKCTNINFKYAVSFQQNES